LKRLCDAQDVNRNTYGFSFDISGLGHHLVLLPKTTGKYVEASARTRRRKSSRLRGIVQCIGMTNIEAVCALASKKELESYMAPNTLTVQEKNALLMTRKFTQRDLQSMVQKTGKFLKTEE